MILVIQSDQERSTTALLKLQSRSGRWFWVHCVLQVKDTSDECQHPIIVCTNQVLTYVYGCLCIIPFVSLLIKCISLLNYTYQIN